MQNRDAEVIGDASRWLQSGKAVYLVTVARTWGSSPRPVGSLLAATEDGQVTGSVSGGCVEADLLGRLTHRELRDGFPKQVCYGTTRDEAHRFGLPCGGRLELVVEYLTDPAALEPLRCHLAEGRIVQRQLDIQTGAVKVKPLETAYEEFHFEPGQISRTFGPRWHLLLVGAGHISRYVAEFAHTLDFRVTLCDPRIELAQNWSTPGVHLTHIMPDEAVTQFSDPRTAIITLAHDPRIDDLALMEALLSEAFYVGALGSRRSSQQRRERLARMDVPQTALERLHAPVGLPLGSHTPAEIALSIIADVTAVRNRRQPAVYAHLDATDANALPAQVG